MTPDEPEIPASPPAELVHASALQRPSHAPPLSRQPAHIYLEQLGSGSRRTMRTALATIVHLVTPVLQQGGGLDGRAKVPAAVAPRLGGK